MEARLVDGPAELEARRNVRQADLDTCANTMKDPAVTGGISSHSIAGRQKRVLQG